MPIFDFQCDKCNKTVEKITTIAEADRGFGCECGKGKMVKQTVSRFNFSLKGNWFKNNGKY